MLITKSQDVRREHGQLVQKIQGAFCKRSCCRDTYNPKRMFEEFYARE